MLEKPEEKEFHKKWESLYVFTGRRSDLTTMISIAVINPMILYVFIGYVGNGSVCRCCILSSMEYCFYNGDCW